MADLSKARARSVDQERITNNRDAILPTRRNDRLPDVVVSADMRNGYRGNAVDETRRALGLINDTAEKAYQIGVQQTALNAPADRAAGSLDAAAGRPAMSKAEAYSTAYYGAKAEADLTHWSADVGTQLQDIIDKGGKPEDVKAYMEQRVREFTQNAQHDYPSPQAQHQLGVGLLKYASELDAKVTAQFKEKADQELVSNVGFNLVNKLDQGEQHPSVPSETRTQTSDSPTFTLPVAGRITSKFGEGRDQGRHNGVDIAAPKGSPVGAAAPGEVVQVGHDDRSGTFVKIKHADGSTTSYSHLGSVSVKEGDTVDAAGKLGTVGVTGHTTGPHTHFVYRDPNGNVQDPQGILGKPIGVASIQVPNLKPAPAVVQNISAHFEESLAQLRAAGIDPKAAKHGLIDSIVQWGTNPQDPHPEELLAFANSHKADGKSPSLSPEERQAIQNASVTAFGYQKKLENEHKKAAQDAVEDQLYAGITSGKDMKAAINEAHAKGVFDASEAMAWQTHNRVELDRGIQGKANETLVNNLEVELASKDVDLETFRERIVGYYNTGQLGTGVAAGNAFSALMRAAKDRRASKPSNTPEGQAGRGFLNDVLRPESDDLRGNKQVSALYRGAQVEWANKVDAGADPMKAAQEVADAYGPKIDQAIRRRPAAAAPPAPGQAARPSQAPHPPADNAAALAQIQALARANAAKRAALTK